MTDEEKKAIKDCDEIFIRLDDMMSEESANDYRISYLTLTNLIEKQSKEIEELSDKLTEKICKGVEEEILEEYRQTIISKDKEIEDHIENKELINQILGLEKNANINKTLEKIIILNNFEDKIKAEIEELKNKNKGYDTAYNLGKTYSNKKWEDKIKAKIEYYEKIDNPVGKRVLQSLLEKE